MEATSLYKFVVEFQRRIAHEPHVLPPKLSQRMNTIIFQFDEPTHLKKDDIDDEPFVITSEHHLFVSLHVISGILGWNSLKMESRKTMFKTYLTFFKKISPFLYNENAIESKFDGLLESLIKNSQDSLSLYHFYISFMLIGDHVWKFHKILHQVSLLSMIFVEYIGDEKNALFDELLGNLTLSTLIGIPIFMNAIQLRIQGSDPHESFSDLILSFSKTNQFYKERKLDSIVDQNAMRKWIQLAIYFELFYWYRHLLKPTDHVRHYNYLYVFLPKFEQIDHSHKKISSIEWEEYIYPFHLDMIENELYYVPYLIIDSDQKITTLLKAYIKHQEI